MFLFLLSERIENIVVKILQELNKTLFCDAPPSYAISCHISYYKTVLPLGKDDRISSNTPLAQSLLLSFSLHFFRFRQLSHTCFDQVPFAFIARQTSLVVVILILSF